MWIHSKSYFQVQSEESFEQSPCKTLLVVSPYILLFLFPKKDAFRRGFFTEIYNVVAQLTTNVALTFLDDNNKQTAIMQSPLSFFLTQML